MHRPDINESRFTERNQRTRRRAGPIALAAVLALAIGILAFVAVPRGRSRPIYLINGLNRPYTVSVNGQEQKLSPLEEVLFRVQQGEVSIKVIDAELNLPEQTVVIQSPFWRRPFNRPLIIFNPDALAPLLWEKSIYRVQGKKKDDYQFALYCGEAFYEFQGIHHKFSELPESIESPGSGGITRYRVSLWRELAADPALNVQIMADQLGPEAAQDLSSKHYRLGDKRPEFSTYLHDFLSAENFADFIKPHLADRPIRVQDHRHYQDAVTITNGRSGLEAEYRDLLDQEPSAITNFLLSRVVLNHEEEDLLLQNSIDTTPPEPSAYYRLGTIRMSEGRFEEARDLLAQARRLDSSNQDFMLLHVDSLAAAGQYDSALAELQSLSQGSLDWLRILPREIAILSMAGNPERAKKAIADSLQPLRDPNFPGEHVYLNFYFLAELAYTMGDVEQYEQLIKKEVRIADDPRIVFRRSITTGDITSAEEAHRQLVGPKHEAKKHIRLLLLYMAARLAEDPSAERFASEAAEEMNKLGREQILLGRTFAKDDKPDEDFILNLRIDTEIKKVYLAAFGLRFPEKSEVYFETVRTLNFWPGYPHLTLNEVFDEFAGKPAENPAF